MKTKAPNTRRVAVDRAKLGATFARGEDFLVVLRKVARAILPAMANAETVLLSREGDAYMRTSEQCARVIARKDAELARAIEMAAEQLCAKLARPSKTAAKRAA